MSERLGAPRPTRVRAFIAGTVLGALAGATGGALGMNAYNHYQSNEDQPGCSIDVEAGDTLDGIDRAISAAGDRVHGPMLVYDRSTGDQVTREQRPDVAEDGSMILSPGRDRIVIDHVSRAACEAARVSLHPEN